MLRIFIANVSVSGISSGETLTHVYKKNHPLAFSNHERVIIGEGYILDTQTTYTPTQKPWDFGVRAGLRVENLSIF